MLVFARRELRRRANNKEHIMERKAFPVLSNLFLKIVAGIWSAVRTAGREYARGMKAQGELMYRSGEYPH